LWGGGVECGSDVADFLRSYMNINPSPLQIRILHHLSKNNMSGVAGPRASGITTAVLGHLLYNFVDKNHQTIVLMANNMQSAKHNLTIFRDMMLSINHQYIDINTNIKCTKWGLKLINGSRVMATNTVRSFEGAHITHLFVDDFYKYNYRDGSELLDCIYPVMARNNGQIILGSTGGTVPVSSNIFPTLQV